MESPFPAKISPRTNPADEKQKVSMKDRLGGQSHQAIADASQHDVHVAAVLDGK